MLAAAAGPGAAFVVPTAAARQKPEQSVDHAKAWFRQFGVKLEELPVLKPADARSAALVERARGGGLFYLVGGDPGWVAEVLRGSVVWAAIFEAWRGGAALAGSSAGAMALCSHTLVRAKWPNHVNRRPAEGLGVVPKTAVLPHFDTFGHKWIDSAQATAPDLCLLGVDERSAAVWDGSAWLAAGPGAITVVNGKKVVRFTSGQRVSGVPQPIRMLPKQ